MENLKNNPGRTGRQDLSLNQIQEIFMLRDRRVSFQKISEIVGCSKSRACELYNHKILSRVDRKLPWQDKGKLVYLGIRENRGRPRNRFWNLSLFTAWFVEEKLKDKHSPATIAELLKSHHPEHYVCKETIYQYIYTERRDLIPHLVRSGKTRRNNRASNHKSRLRAAEIEKKRIDERSVDGNQRVELGHKESDFIVSAKGGKSCLLVLIDRKSRKVYLRKTANREADTTRRAIFQILSLEKNSGGPITSLAIDNDTAHNHLPLLEPVFKEEELKVVFCNPYRPWERGSVEAIIGILRRWFPKGTNFDEITDHQIGYVQEWFNNRPMMVLGYATPNQVHTENLKLAA